MPTPHPPDNTGPPPVEASDEGTVWPISTLWGNTAGQMLSDTSEHESDENAHPQYATSGSVTGLTTFTVAELAKINSRLPAGLMLLPEDGLDGEDGFPGVAGVAGTQGIQGIQGITGLTGDTGPEGPEGPEGPPGADGSGGGGGSSPVLWNEAYEPDEPVIVKPTLFDSDIPATIARDSEVTAAVSAHESDTSVHGIADTTVLATDAEVATAVSTHESDTSVHGIADTTVLATDAEVASAVSTHEADTSVHGIANTTLLATDAEVATAVSDHAALADPHTGYVLESAHTLAAHDALLLATDAEMTTHAGAADPHTVYQKESEKAAANGYASLGADTLVPQDQLGTGAQDGTKFLRDDGTWQAVVAAGANSLYAPGSFTVATGNFAMHVKRLKLTTTQRATLAGDARLRIT